MQKLKKLQTKFNKLGCKTEIDDGTLWISEGEGCGNFDIIFNLEKLPQQEYRWGRYDCGGETQFALSVNPYYKAGGI